MAVVKRHLIQYAAHRTALNSAYTFPESEAAGCPPFLVACPPSFTPLGEHSKTKGENLDLSCCTVDLGRSCYQVEDIRSPRSCEHGDMRRV